MLYLLIADMPLHKVAYSNQLIREAQESYRQQNYIMALVKYRHLNKTLRIKNSNIQLNLAHCYFINGDTAQARKYYNQFADSKNEEFRGIACQQLGVLAFNQKEYMTSLTHFKKALQALPHNDDIRYNYELLKKITTKIKKPKKDRQDPEKAKDQEQKIPPTQEQAETKPATTDSRQKEEKEKQEKIEKDLKKINLSQEKAQMILDAMKSSETKYIQQQKKIPGKSQGKNYPDW